MKTKRSLLFLLLMLSSVYVDAQPLSPTLGGEYFATIATDTSQVHQLIKKSDSFRYLKTDYAISLLKNAKTLSFINGYYGGVAEAQMKIGICYAIKGDFLLSLATIREALPFCYLSHSQRKLLSLWYASMTVPFSGLGQTDSAVAYTLEGLKIAVSINDTALIIRNYTNMASALINNLQFEDALSYANKARALSMQTNDSVFAPVILYNIAAAYSNLHDTAQQYIYAKKALESSRKSNNRRTEILSLGTIGFYHLYTGKTQKAIEYFHKTLDLTNEGNHNDKFLPTRGLAQTYYALGELDKALEYGNKALKHAQNTSLYNWSLTYLYYIMAKTHHDLGNDSKAYDFSMRYIHLKDSIIQVDKDKIINHLEIKYRLLEKEREITQNELLLARQKNAIKNKNAWIAAISLTTLLLAISIYLILRTTKRKIKIINQKKEISKLKAIMSGEERERKRIARELHDGVGGLISAAVINLNTLSDTLGGLERYSSFSKTEALIKTIDSEIRKTAHNLMPDILLSNNLPEAIRLFCSYVSKDAYPNIQIQSYGSFTSLKQELILFIYRIIQELVQNILKHAQATEVFIELYSDSHRISITVEDNGIGYNKNEKKEGMGLDNIADRVAAIKGTLQVETKPNEGTSVYIEFDRKEVRD